MLGEIVARHRGRSWYDVLRDEVLLPLGMTRTTYDAEPPVAPGLAVHPFADVTMPEVVQDLGAMAPAGQLWSTLSDLARWVAFIAGDTADVLSEGSLAEMRQTRVIADDPEWKSAYGLGFQVLRFGPRELVGHGGSVPGYLAFVAVDVERRTGLIELANATTGAVFSGHELLEILEAHEPHVPDAWQPVDGVPADLLDALGVWHWGPSSPYVLRLLGQDELEISAVAGGRPGQPLRPQGRRLGRHGGLLAQRATERRPAGRRVDQPPGPGHVRVHAAAVRPVRADPRRREPQSLEHAAGSLAVSAPDAPGCCSARRPSCGPGRSGRPGLPGPPGRPGPPDPPRRRARSTWSSLVDLVDPVDLVCLVHPGPAIGEQLGEQQAVVHEGLAQVLGVEAITALIGAHADRVRSAVVLGDGRVIGGNHVGLRVEVVDRVAAVTHH